MDTTDKDPVLGITDLQELSSQIVRKERRLSIDLTAMLNQLPDLVGIAKIKLYRLSERDVERGRAALTEMTVEAIDSIRQSVVSLKVTGRYLSSDPAAEKEVTFEKAICTISPYGDIQIFLEDNSHWLIVKRSVDPVLIFIDQPGEKRGFPDIRRVVELARSAISRLRRH